MDTRELTEEQRVQYIKSLEANMAWQIMKEEIDKVIKVTESNIFSIDGDNDKLYTMKDLYILQRKCLLNLKAIPEKIVANYTKNQMLSLDDVLGNGWVF